MKIEIGICEETRVVVCTFLVGVVAVAIAFLAYRYNVTVYEKGYTQQQLEHSQLTIWVKP